MKRIITNALGVLFLATVVASCGKSTKGKMINDWKITGFTQQVNDDGDSYSINMSNTTYTYTTNNTTKSGTVSQADFIIKKDGTWTRTIVVNTPESSGSTITTNVDSGTWSFIGKTKGDDFKKNERVIFNILKSSETDVFGGNTQAYNDTYLVGQNQEIYTITESKAKSLKLESKMAQTSTSNSGSSASSGTITYTLEKK